MNLMIDTRVLGYGGHSGVEEYASHVISGMLLRGNAHRFSFFHNGTRIKPLSAQFASAAHTRINWRLPNKLLDVSFGLLRVPRLENADVVFSPHFNIVETGRMPHVITFHDLSFVHHPDFFPLRKRLWHALQRPMREARRAAHIIAVSQFTKADLVATFGIAPEKISVIYSGIDAAFRPLPKDDERLAAFRAELGLERPFFLYLGTLEPRKNVSAIIRAFNAVKTAPAYRDFRLIIAGAPGWLYQNILREAAQSQNRDDIVFFGPVKTKDRVLLYNSSEAFVYPSFFEGFGLPPLEAQACGIPAVVADRTALPEILGRAALFVNPWRTGDLADSMRAAALGGARREKLITLGLKNAARFSWEHAARETLRVIETYAHKRPKTNH